MIFSPQDAFQNSVRISHACYSFAFLIPFDFKDVLVTVQITNFLVLQFSFSCCLLSLMSNTPPPLSALFSRTLNK